MNHPHQQFNPSFRPLYPPPYNPYGAQSIFHQVPSTPNYQGCYQGNVGQYPQGVYGSPAASMGFFGAPKGSSPMGSPSPMSMSQGTPASQPVGIEESSESSLEASEKKGERRKWSEQENIRLISAWLQNSNDPIDGNSKKAESYWKQVVADYNKNSTEKERRTAAQLKTHWATNSQLVSKFNGCWNV